ncbi:MAG: hypothetical protein JSU98_00435 [Gemmatimonadales bacterium]|nr:MAG: hypothetical protein JSU98_00435 [Gemmatimonadales bacterium]
MRHPFLPLLIAAIAAFVPFSQGAAQEGSRPTPATGDVRATAWGLEPVMEMLYERTIFNIDVLTVSIEVDPATEAALRSLVDGTPYAPSVADSLVERVMGSQAVLIRSRFHRKVSLDQFLDGMRDNLEGARKGGFLTRDELDVIVTENTRQFQLFRERGFRTDESITYRILGDRLHIVVQDPAGGILFENRAEGEVRRGALLGSYLAPDSEFRDGLVRSLFATGG